MYKEAYDLFIKIREERSRKEKEAIFSSYYSSLGVEDHRVFENVLHDIFSPRKTTGISNVSVNKYGCIEFSETAFSVLLNKLFDRRLTGNTAREEVKIYLENSEPWVTELFNWVCKREATRCGMTPKSFNKYLNVKIPSFNNQKAEGISPTDVPVGEDFVEYVEWEKVPDTDVMVEYKYDGFRTYFQLYRDEVEKSLAITSTGAERTSLKTIAVELAKAFKRDCVLDTEAFYKSYSSTSSLISGDDDIGLNTDLEVLVIGMFESHEEWDKSFEDELDVTFEDFRKRFIDIKGDIETEVNIKPTMKRLIPFDDREHFEALLKRSARIAVDSGYEGIMIKVPDEKYRRHKGDNRKGQWKVKAIEFVDAVVVDFKEGTGKNKGKLGAFIVEYNGVRNDVGGSHKGSLTDDMRLEYWLDRNELVDKTIKVKTYGVSSDNTFRHAGFVEFHGDK